VYPGDGKEQAKKDRKQDTEDRRQKTEGRSFEYRIHHDDSRTSIECPMPNVKKTAFIGVNLRLLTIAPRISVHQ
jgi:hypothetical protein